ncbi:hypothetical protein KAH43_06930, partial [Candidatus Bipolaricaulota bacterium]|nr:hypothetical protein [Candidatus Bipolaricaulota bacterium]
LHMSSLEFQKTRNSETDSTRHQPWRIPLILGFSKELGIYEFPRYNAPFRFWEELYDFFANNADSGGFS